MVERKKDRKLAKGEYKEGDIRIRNFREGKKRSRE